jgi:hypothetical protein
MDLPPIKLLVGVMVVVGLEVVLVTQMVVEEREAQIFVKMVAMV